VLKYSCGTTGKLNSDRFRRAQASGGGRYPIEVYPVVFRPSAGSTSSPQASSGQVPGDPSAGGLKAGLYRYILQEAGHIGQDAYLVSEALGMKCCALGGTRDENLEKLIDIDGVTESVVYALALGK